MDLEASRKWIEGVLLRPGTVAGEYKEENAPWLQSLLNITIPAYVVALVIGLVLGLVTGGSFGFTVFGFIIGVISGVIFTLVVAFVLDFFAGVFDGEKNFDSAYAVVALAVVPAALGNALGVLPWLGWLLSLAGSIYALVLTYQFIPVLMTVPEASRVKHFVVSLVVCFISLFVLSSIIAAATVPFMIAESVVSSSSSSDEADRDAGGSIFDDAAEDMEASGEAVSGGLFGGLERQGKIVEEAEQDTYSPPSSGKLTEAQVERYVANLEKATRLRERLTKTLENVDQDNPSLSDIFGGVGDMARAANAEMEVVKTGGGNWAEHQWVRNQIETARVHQDGTEAIEHNWALIQDYLPRIDQHQ